MADWKERLEQEYRSKRAQDEAESQRRLNHDQFVSSHGYSAWQELIAKIDEACRHLSTKANARFTVMHGSQHDFVVSGGTAPLDVSLDVATRRVNWELRDTSIRGTLKPDRQGDELVYRDNGAIFPAVEDAALFLMRKVF